MLFNESNSNQLKIALRDYQEKSLNDIYNFYSVNGVKNLCVELPTGSGKSHVIAAFCKQIIQGYASPKSILMLTHVKELIEQNAEKMIQHWPNAPLGIYSASVGQKNLSEPITFAGVQSIVNVLDEVSFTDIIIVDECHLINHKDQGSYRKIINYLKEINPNCIVLGFTATPYRLGCGYLDQGEDALFDEIINPVNVKELIDRNFLATLRSKLTDTHFDLTGVKKRGGEFVEKDLQDAVNTTDINEIVVEEIIAKAGDRKHWLIFCTGIEHAENIKNIFLKKNIAANVVTGQTKKKARNKIIEDFKTGKIKALTNANVLTTGFDFPDIDLIAMLRPTLSPNLYVQIAGRGLRLKSHTDHCLILDFAGNVERHGPIIDVLPPDLKKSKPGDAPVKSCPECAELVHTRTMICPCCYFAFKVSQQDKTPMLYANDIMGQDGLMMKVTDWKWFKHISKSGNEMLKVSYYGKLTEKPITEYFPLLNGGYAQKKAMQNLSLILTNSKVAINQFYNYEDLEDAARLMNVTGVKPESIVYMKEGMYERVIERYWKSNQDYYGSQTA